MQAPHLRPPLHSLFQRGQGAVSDGHAGQHAQRAVPHSHRRRLQAHAAQEEHANNTPAGVQQGHNTGHGRPAMRTRRPGQSSPSAPTAHLPLEALGHAAQQRHVALFPAAHQPVHERALEQRQGRGQRAGQRG